MKMSRHTIIASIIDNCCHTLEAHYYVHMYMFNAHTSFYHKYGMSLAKFWSHTGQTDTFNYRAMILLIGDNVSNVTID